MTEPDQRIDRRLDRLAEVSARGQWQLDQAIDWTCSPAASPWVPRRSYVGLVSQLFHGEAAALALTGRLLAAFSHDAHARAALVWQEVDERRHVAVHVACLARLGEIAESTSVLKEALEAMLPWQGPPAALVLANNIVLEEAALSVYPRIASALGCPLFSAVARRLARDEARHVRFGHIVVPPLLAALTVDERVDIYRWLRQLWTTFSRSALTDHATLLKTFGLPLSTKLEHHWSRQADALVALGLLTPAQVKAA